MLTVAMPPLHREMEYAVALEQAPEALDRVRSLIGRLRLLVNFVMVPLDPRGRQVRERLPKDRYWKRAANEGS